MTVLQDSEVPSEIRTVVRRLRHVFGVGVDDVYVVDADHEELPEGSYAIWAECLADFDWADEIRLRGWWTEWVMMGCCLAVHPAGL